MIITQNPMHERRSNLLQNLSPIENVPPIAVAFHDDKIPYLHRRERLGSHLRWRKYESMEICYVRDKKLYCPSRLLNLTDKKYNCYYCKLI